MAFLALVILIAVLLSISVTLKVHYEKEKGVFRCTAHYLFLTHVLSPPDEKKQKKKRTKKEKSSKEKDKKSSFSHKIKSEGIRGFIDDIKDIVKGAWRMIVCVLRRAVIKRLRLRLTVAGEDAADTAVIYGYANAAIYPIISAFLENVRSYKELDVEISPVFSEGAEPDFEFAAELKLKPARFFGAIFESREELSGLISAIKK